MRSFAVPFLVVAIVGALHGCNDSSTPTLASTLPAGPTAATSGSGGAVAGGDGSTGGGPGSGGTESPGSSGDGGMSGKSGKGGASGASAKGGSAAGGVGASGMAGKGGSAPEPSVCGDGKRTGIEACDGADVGSATCETVIAKGSTGALGCSVDCLQFDSSGCSGAICSMAGTQPDAPWPMAGRCSARTGRSPWVGPQTPTVKWKVALKAANVVVGANALYAAGTSKGLPTLYAISFGGTVLWQFVADMPGFGWTPAIGVDGTIFLPALANGDSNILAMYAVSSEGALKWAQKSPGLGSFTTPALGPDGTVYFSTDGTLHAATPDGNPVWGITASPVESQPCLPVCMESPGVFSSPAVSQGGDVYAESQDGHLYSLHPDGSKAWTVEVFSAGLMNTLPHVAVGADGTIFTGWSHIDGARLQAFHPDGSSAWTFLAPCCGIPQASVGADGTAYFVAAPTVGLETIAVDSDGNKRWSVPTSGDVPDSIAIDAQGTTFFNRGGTLYAVDSLGVVRWSMVGPARTAIGRDRTLYGVDGGYLYAIGP